MAKRRWTVVFVPHGSEPSKIIEVSYGVLKTAASGVGVLLPYGTWTLTSQSSPPMTVSVGSTPLDIVLMEN